MKKTIATLSVFALMQLAFAAPPRQTPDVCIIAQDSFTQDTLVMFNFPLDNYLLSNGITINKSADNCRSQSCARGYQAEWIVRNDSLFISDLRGCNASMSWCDQSDISLRAVFEDRFYENEPVFADWVTGNYRLFAGTPVPLLQEMIFPTESLLTIKQGKLKKTKHFTNIKIKSNAMTVETSIPDTILNLLQQNIDWEILPKRKSIWVADIVISILKNGKTKTEIKTNADRRFKAGAAAQFTLALKAVRWAEYRQQGKKTEVRFTRKVEVNPTDNTMRLIR